MERRKRLRTAVAVALLAAAATATAADEMRLSCEAADRGLSGTIGHFRVRIAVEDRDLKGRHLSLDRFRDGFGTGEPEFVFEPVTRLGELAISFCNSADWPRECARQQPSRRDLMVGAMSAPADPVFLSGYAGCPFCPLAIVQIATDEAGTIGFRYFEFDLVEGTCRRDP
jgi:hypothetical protein